MELPHRFADLHDYVFTRLRGLLDEHPAGGVPLSMSVGEPRHAMPDFVAPIIAEHIARFADYPPTEGIDDLLDAIARWFHTRYGVSLSPQDNIISLCGTREGLFSSALALCPERKNNVTPKILVPNPFYQVYGAAALACWAQPIFVPATEDAGFLPNFKALPAKTLDETAICYLCSPSNPQGATADEAYWQDLLSLAEKHDFIIFADECYGDIYEGSPPLGGLQMARKFGADENRVVSFHSLSKRSNLPGLRSGFAASGAKNIAALNHLRSYSAPALPLPLQRVSIAAWNDEVHVKANRALYREKYQIANKLFGGVAGYTPIRAGFFLWLPVKDSESATLKLWQDTGVQVLPGAFLSKKTDDGIDPGKNYIRVALCAPLKETETGLRNIAACLFNKTDLKHHGGNR